MKGYQKELERVKNVLRGKTRGMTILEISQEVGLNRNSVAKYLDILLLSGQVEMRPVGRAKMYFISQRVPMWAILNCSSDYIVVLNREYKIVQANDGFLDFLNVEREAIIGRELEIAPTCVSDNRDILSGLNKGLDGKASSKELCFQIDDAEIYFRINFVPTSFDDGEPGATMIMENITERKRAEKLYKSIVELSPDSIMTLDTKGVITSCNAATTRITGYSKDELLAKQFSKVGLFKLKDVPKYADLFSSMIRGKEMKPFKIDALHKDGTPVSLEVRFALLKEGSRATGVQLVLREISESKKVKEPLRKI